MRLRSLIAQLRQWSPQLPTSQIPSLFTDFPFLRRVHRKKELSCSKLAMLTSDGLSGEAPWRPQSVICTECEIKCTKCGLVFDPQKPRQQARLSCLPFKHGHKKVGCSGATM